MEYANEIACFVEYRSPEQFAVKSFAQSVIYIFALYHGSVANGREIAWCSTFCVAYGIEIASFRLNRSNWSEHGIAFGVDTKANKRVGVVSTEYAIYFQLLA